MRDVPGAVRSGPQTAASWRPLLLFSLYRCALAGVLALLDVWGVAPRDPLAFDIVLFRWVIASYLLFAIAALAAVTGRWARMEVQVFVQMFVDIIAITMLMHAAGGLSSGFGLLLVITVAGGSILTEGRIAILFAALAALSVLAQQIYVYLVLPEGDPQYTHAGMLGAAFFATAIVTSVSARRLRASEALAARREFDLANLAQLNEHIIARMQSGVLAVDDGGRVRLMNESAQRMLGIVSWSIGDRLARLSRELDRIHRTWRQAREQPSYLLQVAAGGVRLVASFAGIGPGGRDGTVVFLEDTAATTQRAQQLKLASLGRLAGSIAHEIRNPLGAISHAGQLLEESSNLDGADRRLTRIIRDNSQRMNAMIENVLQLGRGRTAEPASVDLARWLPDFVAEFDASRPGAGRVIRCEVTTPELIVRIDPSQLHQVVWNLCDNALQHAGEPPRVRLEAGFGEHTARPYLDVSDNGGGIAGEDVDRLFEPFFTTRQQGTGLGLYIARELCEGNRASLTLETSERGCRFRITFPDPRRRGVVAA